MLLVAMGNPLQELSMNRNLGRWPEESWSVWAGSSITSPGTSTGRRPGFAPPGANGCNFSFNSHTNGGGICWVTRSFCTEWCRVNDDDPSTGGASRASHSLVGQKTMRIGVALAAWASGYLALKRWFRHTPRVRVLTYHRFRSCKRDPFSVGIEQFEAQMRWLAERNLAISLADLEAFLDGRLTLRDRVVLVTIDDGFEEISSLALPILRRYRIPQWYSCQLRMFSGRMLPRRQGI